MVACRKEGGLGQGLKDVSLNETSRASADPRGGAQTLMTPPFIPQNPNTPSEPPRTQPKRRPMGRVGAGTAACGLDSVLELVFADHQSNMLL